MSSDHNVNHVKKYFDFDSEYQSEFQQRSQGDEFNDVGETGKTIPECISDADKLDFKHESRT